MLRVFRICNFLLRFVLEFPAQTQSLERLFRLLSSQICLRSYVTIRVNIEPETIFKERFGGRRLLALPQVPYKFTVSSSPTRARGKVCTYVPIRNMSSAKTSTFVAFKLYSFCSAIRED